jgi:predicted ferric reductase
MSANASQEIETAQPAISLKYVVLVFLGVTAGSLLAGIVLPLWLPGLTYSLLGEQPKAYWLLSRGSAWAAFTLLWLSMVSGLIVTNKIARLWPGGPTAIDLHEYFSLLGMSLGLFHALILMGDHYINYTLPQVLIPFNSVNYRPLWVGIGQLSFYLGLVVTFTFYVRKQIKPRTWRLIHYLSFAQFLMVMVHGIYSGTDVTAPWAIQVYWWSAASLLFLFIYRMLITRLSVAR